jgi:hypothetical protein
MALYRFGANHGVNPTWDTSDIGDIRNWAFYSATGINGGAPGWYFCVAVDNNGNITQSLAPLPSAGDTVQSDIAGHGTLTVGEIQGSVQLTGGTLTASQIAGGATAESGATINATEIGEIGGFGASATAGTINATTINAFAEADSGGTISATTINGTAEAGSGGTISADTINGNVNGALSTSGTSTADVQTAYGDISIGGGTASVNAVHPLSGGNSVSVSVTGATLTFGGFGGDPAGTTYNLSLANGAVLNGQGWNVPNINLTLSGANLTAAANVSPSYTGLSNGATLTVNGDFSTSGGLYGNTATLVCTNAIVSSNSGFLQVGGTGQAVTFTIQGNLTLDNGDLASTIGSQYDSSTLDVLGRLVIGGVPVKSTFPSDLIVSDNSSITADNLTVGDAGKGRIFFSPANSPSLDVNGPVVLGNQTSSQGTIEFDNDPHASFQAGALTIGVNGNGYFYQDGTAKVSGKLTLGAGTGSGSLSLSGTLTAANVTLGSQQGGVGNIGFASGAGMDIGGSSSAPADTMQIASNAAVSGNGSISGVVTGSDPVSDTTTTPTYSLNIENSGTIEANGDLVLDGNLSGDGQVLIGPNATLELGGAVAQDVKITFLPDPARRLGIYNPKNDYGVIEQFAPGSTIDFPTVPFVAPGNANDNSRGASTLFETGQGQESYVLQVLEGGQTYEIKFDSSQHWDGGLALSSDGRKIPDGNGATGTLIKLTYGSGSVANYTQGAVTGYSTRATNTHGLDPYSGVVNIKVRYKDKTTGYGSGFIIAPGFVLTAAHVVKDASGIGTSVLVSSGGQTAGAGVYFGATAVEANPKFKPSSNGELNGYQTQSDFAVIYVPGLPSGPGSTFGLRQGFSDGTVNVTGYPGTVPGNGHPVPSDDGVQSTQFTDIGHVSTPTPGYLYCDGGFDGIVAGNSGGPLWIYNGNQVEAVGLVSTGGRQKGFTADDLKMIDNLKAAASKTNTFYRRPPTDVDIVSATVSQTGDEASGQTVRLFLSLSENVTVSGSGPTLTMNDGGTATYDAAASTGTELVFDHAIGSSEQTSELEITGINSGQAVQGRGETSVDFSVLENLPTGLSINSPLISKSISCSQTGEVGSGQSVLLTLTMSEPITVNIGAGTPTLTLNDGASATYDAAASNPSASTLVFDYTVASTDQTANLEVIAVNLPSGTSVQDSAGCNADFSAALNTPTGLQVGPVFVTAITSSLSGVITTGQTDHLTLAMSAGVTVDTTGGLPTLSLSDGATATYDAAASNAPAGTLVFDYTVGPQDYATNLTILGLNANGATVTDSHGVSADFSVAAQYTLSLDVNAPIVTNVTPSPGTGEVDSGQQARLTLTMSEAVTVNTIGGVPSLSLSDGATATYDAGASNPSAGTLVFDYTVGATDETANLQVTQVNLDGATIADANGNAADFSAAANFNTNLQIGPVFVSSITPSLTGEIFTGQTDRLTLAMSAGVTVNMTGGLPSLSLSDGAAATYDAAASNPSAGTLVFDYTPGASDYATDLSIVGFAASGATITDVNGVNADFSAASQYDLGLGVNAAIVTNVTASPSTGEVSSGQKVTLTLVMNEAVTVNTTGGSPTLSLSDSATATYDANASSPSAATLVFDYTVGATDETANLQVAQVNLNGATISDTNGNPATSRRHRASQPGFRSVLFPSIPSTRPSQA